MTEAIMLAAPASGQGKTVITAALLRLLRQRGVRVAAAKVGPDYIDPAFHAAALGVAPAGSADAARPPAPPVMNLDPWAMSQRALRQRLNQLAADAEMLVIEGVMGLFDGVAATARRQPALPANACVRTDAAQQREGLPDASAISGIGSSADLAAMFGIPVLLVLDAARMGATATAIVHGLASLRPDVRVVGVILNRLGSPRHGEMLAEAIENVSGLPVVGRFLRHEALRLPERHLGLVPAGEHEALDAWLDAAAEVAAESLSLCRLANLARPPRPLSAADNRQNAPALPPLAQRLAIARDAAFCFTYAHLLADWRAQGAEIRFFSPLADEAPPADAEAIFLPGGYPELHAGRLAAASSFIDGMQQAARRGVLILGECGGYMVLGRGLVDARGEAHAMCDLLPFTTSFADRRLHLGYRRLVHDSPLPYPRCLRGHEFHYATTVWRDPHPPALFSAQDAAGNVLEPMGMRVGSVMGSFAHVISAGGEGA